MVFAAAHAGDDFDWAAFVAGHLRWQDLAEERSFSLGDGLKSTVRCAHPPDRILPDAIVETLWRCAKWPSASPYVE